MSRCLTPDTISGIEETSVWLWSVSCIIIASPWSLSGGKNGARFMGLGQGSYWLPFLATWSVRTLRMCHSCHIKSRQAHHVKVTTSTWSSRCHWFGCHVVTVPNKPIINTEILITCMNYCSLHFPRLVPRPHLLQREGLVTFLQYSWYSAPQAGI